jgi:hypothetical protein
MMDFLKPVVVAVTVLSATMAHAGGPVIIEEGQGDAVIAEKPASSIGILPVLGALVLLCLVACGGGDDDPVEHAHGTPAEVSDRQATDLSRLAES